MSKSDSKHHTTRYIHEFNPNAPQVTEEMALDYLAQLTVEIFLENKQREWKRRKENTEESNHILSSFDKGTG